MKTFLVYSKKPLRFVSTNEDISSLKFIQYGFNWKYALGIIRSKFFTFTIAILLIYFAFSLFASMQSIFLALGIIGNPELIFLDEPTTGFDPEARRAFWALILKLRDEGATILLTTHYLDEAEALADRVAVINRGQIIEVSTPAQLGGRATSLATISWRDGAEVKTAQSAEPTQFVQKLAAQFGGEVPELSVKRASLEDIYLQMIGDVHA